MDPFEIIDRLRVMRRQEETAYRCADYFAAVGPLPSTASPSSPRQQQRQQRQGSKPVDEDCRIKMAQWCTQVVDFCKFRRETVGLGLSFLDRFLSTVLSSQLSSDPEKPSRALQALVDRREYQLAAMTTLYMAIKLNEPLEMETSLLAELSRGCYTSTEISRMELDVLYCLGWRVSGPTALGFVSHFLLLLIPDSSSSVNKESGGIHAILLDLCRYQTELAICDYSLVTEKFSVVAIASILNSMEAIGPDDLATADRSAFLELVSSSSDLVIDAPEVSRVRTRLTAIFRKSLGYELRHIAEQLDLSGS